MTLFYLLMIIVLGIIGYHLPQIYTKIEHQRVEKIKQEIDAIIVNNEAEVFAEKLDEYVMQHSVELAVKSDDDETPYSSIPIEDTGNLSHWLDQDLLAYQGVYRGQSLNGGY